MQSLEHSVPEWGRETLHLSYLIDEDELHLRPRPNCRKGNHLKALKVNAIAAHPVGAPDAKMGQEPLLAVQGGKLKTHPRAGFADLGREETRNLPLGKGLDKGLDSSCLAAARRTGEKNVNHAFSGAKFEPCKVEGGKYSWVSLREGQVLVNVWNPANTSHGCLSRKSLQWPKEPFDSRGGYNRAKFPPQPLPEHFAPAPAPDVASTLSPDGGEALQELGQD